MKADLTLETEKVQVAEVWLIISVISIKAFWIPPVIHITMRNTRKLQEKHLMYFFHFWNQRTAYRRRTADTLWFQSKESDKDRTDTRTINGYRRFPGKNRRTVSWNQWLSPGGHWKYSQKFYRRISCRKFYRSRNWWDHCVRFSLPRTWKSRIWYWCCCGNKDSALKEDALFNLFHEEVLDIDGIPIDINPIRPEETGTLEAYLPSVEAYLSEKAAEIENVRNTEPERTADEIEIGDKYRLKGMFEKKK